MHKNRKIEKQKTVNITEVKIALFPTLTNTF